MAKNKTTRLINSKVARPKKPLSGYLAFFKDYHSRNKNLQSKHVMVQAGNAWRKMSAAEKAKWNSKVVQDQMRYAKEIKTWKTKRAFLKRPPNGYAKFLMEFWDKRQHDGRSTAEVSKLVARQWHNLKASEKEGYQKQARQEMFRYTTMMQEFRRTNGSNRTSLMDKYPDLVPEQEESENEEEDDTDEEELEEE